MMRHGKLGLALLATALAVGLPSTADGQWRRAERAPQPEARGWIGVSFEVVRDRRGRAIDILITDVSPGSPAQEAGLRPGDRLLAANDLDEPQELAELSERLHLRPGDHVVLQVRRNDERHRFRLNAAQLPTGYEVGSRIELTLQSDSMVETWVRAMDSLRIELVAEGGQNVRVRRDVRDGGRRVTVVGESGPVIARTGGAGSPQEYEFFIFHGEEHDSLRKEMANLSRVMAELEVRIEERERDLRRVVAGRDGRDPGQDREVRNLQSSLSAATARSEELRSLILEASRNTAGLSGALSPAPGVWSTVRPPEAPAAEEFRPLTPYLLGRNRVAGAEVSDLKPELAAYFEVEGGVLVLDVAPRTPAAIAGLRPGDVITRIDRVGVRTVDDLRFGVSMAGETLPITVIRQGASVQVLLRR